VAESRQERIRRIWREWNEGDRDAALDPELTHPDVELHTQLSRVEGKPYRGYDGVRQWMRDIDEQFAEWRLEIDEIRERGDRILVLGSIHARGRESGLEIDQPLGWILDYRDDRTIRMETKQGHAAAIKAAGPGFATA
jgi:hypothetical protein